MTCLSHYPYFPSLMIIAYVPGAFLKTLVSVLCITSAHRRTIVLFLELIQIVHSSFSTLQLNEKMAHPIM